MVFRVVATAAASVVATTVAIVIDLGAKLVDIRCQNALHFTTVVV